MIVADQNAPTWFHRVLQQINAAFLAIRPDNAVKITGGSINGTPIGQITPAAGAFTTTSVGGLTSTQAIAAPGGASLITTTAALTSFSSTQVGTLTNAPSAGNPTKWVAINDAGVTRFFPCW